MFCMSASLTNHQSHRSRERHLSQIQLDGIFASTVEYLPLQFISIEPLSPPQRHYTDGFQAFITLCHKSILSFGQTIYARHPSKFLMLQYHNTGPATKNLSDSAGWSPAEEDAFRRFERSGSDIPKPLWSPWCRPQKRDEVW